MQPQAPAAPTIAPTATPATPTYKPLVLSAYDPNINPDPNASAADIQRSYQQFQASKANPLDLYNKAIEGLGVADVRTRVQGLRSQLLNTENLLNNVDGSVTGRTQGTLVTEAQRQRLVNLEREPITKDYNTMSGNLNNESANLSDLLGQAKQASDLALAGQSDREQAIKFALEQATGREKSAEDQRRFEAQIALQRQEQARLQQQLNQSAKGGLSLPASSKPQLPSEPKQAVGQLFAGYNPSQDRGYTESVVIPQLVGLMRSNPAYKDASDAGILLTAKQIAYGYRKQVYGE